MNKIFVLIMIIQFVGCKSIIIDYSFNTSDDEVDDASGSIIKIILLPFYLIFALLVTVFSLIFAMLIVLLTMSMIILPLILPFIFLVILIKQR